MYHHYSWQTYKNPKTPSIASCLASSCCKTMWQVDLNLAGKFSGWREWMSRQFGPKLAKKSECTQDNASNVVSTTVLWWVVGARQNTSGFLQSSIPAWRMSWRRSPWALDDPMPHDIDEGKQQETSTQGQWSKVQSELVCMADLEKLLQDLIARIDQKLNHRKL